MAIKSNISYIVDELFVNYHFTRLEKINSDGIAKLLKKIVIPDPHACRV